MEVWCPARESSKDWSLEPADILPLSGNERPARIRRLNNLVGDFVVESDHWQIAHIEWTGKVADSNIQRCRKRMIPDIRRVMARAAGAGYNGYAKLIIQSRDAGNVDRPAVEQRLAPGNARSRTADSICLTRIRPIPE